MKQKIYALWDGIWQYCEERVWLRPVWFGMRVVRKIVRLCKTVCRKALSAAKSVKSNCTKALIFYKLVIFERAFLKAVLKVKKAPSPEPVPYVPDSGERPWPASSGAYVRLDYWASLVSGGSYGHTCYVAKELDKLNPGLTCLMAQPYSLLDDLGVVKNILPARQKSASSEAVIIQGVAYDRQIDRWVSRQKPAYIYERVCLGTMSGARAALKHHTPYIVEYNGSEIEMSRSYEGGAMARAEILESIEDWSLAQATAISAISEQVKLALVKRGIAADKICVNPNGVNTEEYKPLAAEEKESLRKELGFSNEHVVLCFIGTFGGWHGIEILASAMPKVLAAVPQARFLLIGDGNLKHLVDEAISQHEIGDKVVCTGKVAQTDGRRLLQAADVYLSPHSGHMKNMPFFGSPTKLFEYMGLGGGIIGTDLEQIGQVLRPAFFASTLDNDTAVVGDERAILCTPGDSDEFVKACIYLARHPEVAKKLGQNARAAALADFTWEAHVERLWRFVAGDKTASWESEATVQAVEQAQKNNIAINQAGVEAQKQWNTNPCGAVDGLEEMNLDYFLRVEENRYKAESFIREVYPFDQFAGKNVLEIGCGHGTDSIQFARNGANCHVADITDRHLGLTIRNFELQGYPLTWKKCDATVLDYPDSYFDCVYSHGVVHHIPDLQQVLGEIKRVLKPGGTLCISVYNQFSAFHLFSKLRADGWHRRMLFSLGYAGLLSTIEYGADGLNIRPYVKLYRKGEFKRALRKAGFSVQVAGVDNLVPSHFERWQEHYWPKWQKYQYILGWYVYTISQKPL